MNITQAELDSLEASKNETEWNRACKDDPIFG